MDNLPRTLWSFFLCGAILIAPVVAVFAIASTAYADDILCASNMCMKGAVGCIGSCTPVPCACVPNTLDGSTCECPTIVRP